jgi:hypothetical protein
MKMARLAAAWAEQMALVFSVSAMLAAALFILLLGRSPYFWSLVAQTALAAGASGMMGWALACGRLVRPTLGSVLLAGVLGGLLVLPCTMCLGVLGTIPDGEQFSLSDFMNEILLGWRLSGVLTIPAGVLAAVCCRFVLTPFLSGDLPRRSSVMRH